jgi:hypothetical protein
MEGLIPSVLPEPTGAQCAMVIKPYEIKVGEQTFELTVHRPSRLLLRDIELVFKPDLDAAYHHANARSPGAYKNKEAFLRERLLIIPLWQPAHQNLAVISETVTAERRGLCRAFVALADALRPQLGGEWVDASDPRTGQAMFGTPTTTTYNELDGLTQCLKYSFEPHGCCGIVIHPRWGYNAYPVSVFTTAQLPQLMRALEVVAQQGAVTPMPE